MTKRQELFSDLRAVVGFDHVLTDAKAIEPYVHDWRRRYKGQASCVVRPASTAEVSSVVAICGRLGFAIVPQGGNTGLVGGGIAMNGEVVVSLARMQAIRELDGDNNTMTVEAGCTLLSVQQAAQFAKRLFPLSLAAEGTATIGGNISTNAGGVQVLRYGNMRDHVLGLEVVLPDGQVWNGLRSLRKDNTGYDLKHLFIGAEGTLGLVTAAVLKLYPAPVSVATAWITVQGPEAAVKLLNRLRENCGDRVTAFELIGATPLHLLREHLPQVSLPAEIGAWQVLVELSDAWAGAPLDEMLASSVMPLLEEGAVEDVFVASSESQAQGLWRVRESIPEAEKLAGYSVKHDISMKVSVIPAFVSEMAEVLLANENRLAIVCFGHVGDGNLHYNVVMPGENGSDSRIDIGAINKLVHDKVVSIGGSISAEHGIGQLKAKSLKDYKSSTELRLMQAVKHALDPRQCMNPGKIFSEE